MLLPDTLTAFGYSLHALCFNQLLPQQSPHPEGDSISVMAHGPSSDGFGERLVSALGGGILQRLSKFSYLNGSLFDEVVEVQISFLHSHRFIFMT